MLTTKLKMSARTSPFGKRISFGSIPAPATTELSRSFWSSRSMIVKSAGEPERAAVASKHAIADGVKRPAPESAGVERQEVGDAVEHLPRGFVGESEEEDVSRVDAVLEQVGDAVGEGARLARAGAGDDEKRTRRRGHRGVLLLVQFARVIDADRRAGRGALERVFAGHWGTTLESGSRLFNENFRELLTGHREFVRQERRAPFWQMLSEKNRRPTLRGKLSALPIVEIITHPPPLPFLSAYENFRPPIAPNSSSSMMIPLSPGSSPLI